jgi:hypothetical protein
MYANEDEQDDKKSNRRWWYVWECIQTHPFARPLGKADKEGCGWYSIRSSKHQLSRDVEVNGACYKCGRKKRLTPATLSIWRFDNKDDAEAKQYQLNGKRWER